MKRILVYGFYDKSNHGDECFKQAFRTLWPNVHFTFVNQLRQDVVEAHDALWFGGGSFTDQAIRSTFPIESIDKPIAYVGISIGGNVHKDHTLLLKRAKIIIVRDQWSLRYLHGLNAHVTSDLVYAAFDGGTPTQGVKGPGDVVVCLSDHLSPQVTDPVWKYLSFERFAFELAKVLDWYVQQGLRVCFVPFSTDSHHDDRLFAALVVSRMSHRTETVWDRSFDQVDSIKAASIVITMRFHGAIFAHLYGVPFIPIACHSKMHMLCRDVGIEPIDYYSFTDARYFDQLPAYSAPINNAIYIEKAKKTWADTLVSVKELFAL